MTVRALRPDAFKGNRGIVDELRPAFDQLRNAKLLAFTAGGSITAGVKGTLTRSDGVSNTLRFDARLPGQHGNIIFVQSTRRTAYEGPVFDVLVNTTASGDAGSTFTTTFGTDIVNLTAHGLSTGRTVRVSSGTTLPAPLAANTIYFVIGVDANTFKLATTLANAIAGTAIDLTDNGTGTHTLFKQVSEAFMGCAMSPNSARYVLTMINTGGAGGIASEWITVANLSSANAENRPTDFVPTVLASGAGETALTGILRNDHIVGFYNVTAATVVTADCVDTNKFVVLTGSFANTDKAVAIVLPR